MKLTKIMRVSGQKVQLTKEHVQLNLYSPGRAVFSIHTDTEPTGLVELHLGYKVDEMHPYFLGVIEARYQEKSDTGTLWKITCRELVGALTFPASMALRFPTLPGILNTLSDVGIEFTVPDVDYTQNRIPCFYHSGDGISVMRQLGRVFGIQDYIFQQRPDGKIYVGSWHDSGWAKTPVTLPGHLFVGANATKATIIAQPKLRPGLLINDRYIHQTTLSDTKMELQWSHKL